MVALQFDPLLLLGKAVRVHKIPPRSVLVSTPLLVHSAHSVNEKCRQELAASRLSFTILEAKSQLCGPDAPKGCLSYNSLLSYTLLTEKFSVTACVCDDDACISHRLNQHTLSPSPSPSPPSSRTSFPLLTPSLCRSIMSLHPAIGPSSFDPVTSPQPCPS